LTGINECEVAWHGFLAGADTVVTAIPEKDSADLDER
jgi:hypothetical protein